MNSKKVVFWGLIATTSYVFWWAIALFINYMVTSDNKAYNEDNWTMPTWFIATLPFIVISIVAIIWLIGLGFKHLYAWSNDKFVEEWWNWASSTRKKVHRNPSETTRKRAALSFLRKNP